MIACTINHWGKRSRGDFQVLTGVRILGGAPQDQTTPAISSTITKCMIKSQLFYKRKHKKIITRQIINRNS